MGRTFAYTRVSRSDLTTENQVQELEGSGYDIPDHRVFSETISGDVAAQSRPEFCKLIDRMEAGDRLVVTKLDRLGRNAVDVQQTVKMLAARGIKVVAKNLGDTDLTSSAGKMLMTMLAAAAEMERDLLIERTRAGLERAKAQGKQLGRPVAVDTRKAVQKAKADGMSQSKAAKELDVSLSTVKRYWKVS